jgi:hypothetical protein
MAIVVESTSTNQSVSSSSLVVTAPSGIVDGDLLIFCVAYYSSRTLTPPSGFTSITSASNTAAVEVRYKIASSEPSSYTFGLSTAGPISVVMFRISGHNPTTPINVSSNGIGTSYVANHAAPAITTTAADCLAVTAAATSRDRTWTPPSGYGNEIELNTGFDLSTARKMLTSSGTETPGNWTLSSTGDQVAMITFAVDPSAGGAAKPVIFHSHYQNMGWR